MRKILKDKKLEMAIAEDLRIDESIMMERENGSNKKPVIISNVLNYVLENYRVINKDFETNFFDEMPHKIIAYAHFFETFGEQRNFYVVSAYSDDFVNSGIFAAEEHFKCLCPELNDGLGDFINLETSFLMMRNASSSNIFEQIERDIYFKPTAIKNIENLSEWLEIQKEECV